MPVVSIGMSQTLSTAVEVGGYYIINNIVINVQRLIHLTEPYTFNLQNRYFFSQICEIYSTCKHKIGHKEKDVSSASNAKISLCSDKWAGPHIVLFYSILNNLPNLPRR